MSRDDFYLVLGTRLLALIHRTHLRFSETARQYERQEQHRRVVAQNHRMELELGLREPTAGEQHLQEVARRLSRAAQAGFSVSEYQAAWFGLPPTTGQEADQEQDQDDDDDGIQHGSFLY